MLVNVMLMKQDECMSISWDWITVYEFYDFDLNFSNAQISGRIAFVLQSKDCGFDPRSPPTQRMSSLDWVI